MKWVIFRFHDVVNLFQPLMGRGFPMIGPTLRRCDRVKTADGKGLTDRTTMLK